MTELLLEHLRDQLGGQRAKSSQRYKPPFQPVAPHEIDPRAAFGLSQASSSSLGRNFAGIANEVLAIMPSPVGGQIVSRPFHKPDAAVELASFRLNAGIIHALRGMPTGGGAQRTVVLHLDLPKPRLQPSRAAATAGLVPSQPSVDVAWLGYKSHLEASLEAALDETPLEDGFTNPAENLMRKAFEEYPQRVAQWLPGLLRSASPNVSRDVLICLSRLPERLIGALRFEIAADALRATDVRIRYAGVRALEAWGGPDAIRLLDGFKANQRWLADYVQRVLGDLRVSRVGDAIPR